MSDKLIHLIVYHKNSELLSIYAQWLLAQCPEVSAVFLMTEVACVHDYFENNGGSQDLYIYFDTSDWPLLSCKIKNQGLLKNITNVYDGREVREVLGFIGGRGD